MPRAQLAQVDRLLSRMTPVWSPDPDNEPQSLAYLSTADVLGFGGAAGGGKSELALGKALTQHRRTQIFRREGTELGGLIDRVAEILGHRRGLGGKPPIWRRPTPTCELIEFCSVPHPGDEVKYQGRPKDFLVFDEAANFLEMVVRFVMGWVRTTDVDQRTQTLLTFNPPTTAEGRWVLTYFGPWLDKKHHHPAKPGELRWYAMVDGKEIECESSAPFEHEDTVVKPMSRTFFPSRVTNNKFLARTNYISQLEMLPEPLRSQMRHGDFVAGVEDDPYQVIPTAWIEAAQGRWQKLSVKPPMDSIGCDVAMGGRDNTALARRHGFWFDEPILYTGHQSKDGPTIAGWCIAAQRDQAVIHIDLLGVGAEPYGHLMQSNTQTVGVVFGETTHETTAGGRMGFVNVRALLWWRAREMLDPNANNGIALPPDKLVLPDLAAPRWHPVGGKIQVESRDDIVKRIGRSPDVGTAIILAMLMTPKYGDVRALDAGSSRPSDPLARFDRQFADPDRDYGMGGGGTPPDPLSRM